jgi:superoxide reductase
MLFNNSLDCFAPPAGGTRNDKQKHMTKINEVYKCQVCGNIVEMVHTGVGQLVCCGQPMVLQVANTVDASKEKHVPVIEKTGKGFKIKIGSVPHPMEEAHYIEWIEIIADNKSYREFLKPGDKPEALFKIAAKEIVAREYCNLHGLWQS